MSLETFAWTLYVIQTTWMTSTHYNDMGSLSASSGQRTPNCVTSNSNLIFSICNFVHKQRQLWFFSPNSNSNNKHNHVSKFSRLHPPGQQTQNCVTSAAAAALLNDSAASASTAAATTYCSSNPHKTYTKHTHAAATTILLVNSAKTKHTHASTEVLKDFTVVTICQSPHKQQTAVTWPMYWSPNTIGVVCQNFQLDTERRRIHNHVVCSCCVIEVLTQTQ